MEQTKLYSEVNLAGISLSAPKAMTGGMGQSIHVTDESGARLQFQTSWEGELQESRFGISTPMEGQQGKATRNMDLTLPPALLTFLTELDATVQKKLVDNWPTWYPKDKESALYNTIVKTSGSGDTLMRAKVKLDSNKYPTEIYIADESGGAEKSAVTPLLPTDEKKSRLAGARVIAIMDLSTIWVVKSGPRASATVSVQIAHLMAWPRENVGVNIFRNTGVELKKRVREEPLLEEDGDAKRFCEEPAPALSI